MRNLLFFSLLLLTHLAVFAMPQTADEIKAANLQTARLNVSASVYFGDNDDERLPVEADFYLLPKSVVEIMKAADFHPSDEDGQILTDEAAYFEALAHTLNEPDDEGSLLSFLFWDYLKKQKTTIVQTDKTGFGNSETVKTGNYYLFAVKRVNNEILIWNIPVYLSVGNNKIEVDQYNAELAVKIN